MVTAEKLVGLKNTSTQKNNQIHHLNSKLYPTNTACGESCRVNYLESLYFRVPIFFNPYIKYRRDQYDGEYHYKILDFRSQRLV